MKLTVTINDYIKKLDKLLLVLCVGLSVLSVVLLRSIVINNAATVTVTPSLYKTQALITAASLVIALIISFLDYSKIVKLCFLYAPVAIGLSLVAQTAAPQYGEMIRAVILCSTLIYEITGPVITKATLIRAGEIPKQAIKQITKQKRT